MRVSLAVVLPTPSDNIGTFNEEGTVPCLQSQGGYLREQEGFCKLQRQPRENTAQTLFQIHF